MRHLFIAALALVSLVTGVGAQEPYPSRAVTIVVPFPPGGMADLTARPLASALQHILKQPVIVTNKPGAAGVVGMQSVAIAKPDGYTLMIALNGISTTQEIDTLFGRKPAFTRDRFVPIARLTADPPIIVVSVEKPWRTLEDLVDDAKRRPGDIRFSSPGVYSALHLPMEMLLQTARIQMRHVSVTLDMAKAYAKTLSVDLWALPPGTAALTAIILGDADTLAATPATAPRLMKGSELRALATWGTTRRPDFPNIPTMKELGYDIEYYSWLGLFAPKNVPAHVIEVLRNATRQAVEDPEFKTAMEKIQTPIAYLDADAFEAWWNKDAAALATVIKRIGRMKTK